MALFLLYASKNKKAKTSNWIFDAKLVFKIPDISFLTLKRRYGYPGQYTLPAQSTSSTCKENISCNKEIVLIM